MNLSETSCTTWLKIACIELCKMPMALRWSIPLILAVGLGVVDAGIVLRMPNKVQEWTAKCRLTIQRCKFIYKVWSKCRNKENFDKLIRNEGLEAFADQILDFMKCDTKTIANRLQVCGGGIKGRAKTKIMRTSLILLLEQIKKGFQRNMPYLISSNCEKSIRKYRENALVRIG